MFTLRLLKIKIHSRRVFVFKRSLPVFAFLLAGVMIAWPSFVEHKEKFSVAIPSLKMQRAGDVDMEHVRFFSKDKKKNPLTITARTVQEADSEKKIIILKEPDATYILTDGTRLKSQTTYGLAFQDEKYLYFEQPIRTTTDSGYDALSSKVVCDYNADTIGSDERVQIKGPAGMLQAEGFLVSQKGDNIVFKNDVRAVLFQEEKIINEIEKLSFDKMKNYYQESPKNIYITAQKELTIYQPAGLITALENVRISQGKADLTADKVVLNYQKDSSNKTQIKKVEAFDNVKSMQGAQRATADFMGVYKEKTDITTQLLSLTKTRFTDYTTPTQLVILEKNAVLTDKGNIIKADKIYAFYQQNANGQEELERAIVVGNASASNQKQVISGQYGSYNPKTSLIDIYENVRLKQGNSVLNGAYASLNLKTGISSLTGGVAKDSQDTNAPRARVKGSIIPSELEQKRGN